jgi:Mn-dependent DtxR family transcriptional regulator
MNHIRGEGSNSKELAGKLGVSIDTIKRRYKDLLAYGMVKTTRRCGVKLTQRGLEFISKLKLKVGESPIVAE